MGEWLWKYVKENGCVLIWVMPWHSVGRTEGNCEYLRQDSRPPGQYLNLAHLKYRAGVWHTTNIILCVCVCVCVKVCANAHAFVWVKGCTNPGHLGNCILYRGGHYICGSSLWNMLYVILLAPRIFRWLLDFWKICVPLHVAVCVCVHMFVCLMFCTVKSLPNISYNS